jgi:competence protein ComEA
MKIGKWMAVCAAAVLMVAGLAEAKGKTKVELSGVINLNTATSSQLDQLPGVGEKAAKKIIDHRQKTAFQRPEEIVKVKGFGKKKFEKLKPYLTVSGPTTLKAKRVPANAPASAEATAQARSTKMKQR